MSHSPSRRPFLVAVWGARRADLVRLRATIGARDELVAVEAESDAESEAAGAPAWGDPRRWPEPAEGHGALVLLRADAVPGPRWLDRLSGALEATPDVGVAVPLSNGAAWPLCGHDVPDADARGGDITAHARVLAAAGGLPFDVDPGAAGPCLVVRAGALAEVRRVGLAGLSATPWRAVAVPAAYVHVRTGVPLVSACLIVRDEEVRLGDCLAALAGLVDEVVIHDTGSRDATVALARAAGATVIEGRWTDDFSVAREVARRAARGRWVLSVDADEVLEAEPAERAAWRDRLSRPAAFDVATLPLHNLYGSELAPVRAEHAVPLARLLRRTRCHWQGALHEQPATARGAVPVTARFDVPRIIHSGYLREQVEAKAKGERNERIAQADVAGAADDARARFEVARSLLLGESWERALEELLVARAASGDVTFRRAAAEFGSQVALRLGRLDLAAELAGEVGDLGGPAGLVALLTARVALERGQPDRALDALHGLTPATVINDVYSANDASEVVLVRLGALVAMGRVGEAEMALYPLVRSRPLDGRVWLLVARVGEVLGSVPTAAVEHLASSQVEAVCRLAAALAPTHAELILDALLRRFGDVAHVYAYALPVVGLTDVEAARRWSTRLARIGLAERCPLFEILRTPARPPSDRVLAAAALADQRLDAAATGEVMVRVEDAAEELALPGLAPLLAELLDAGSPVADHLVVGAATSPARCLELLEPLVAHGFHDQALTVVLHGATLAGDEVDDFFRAAAARLGTTQAHEVQRRAELAGVGGLVAALAA